MNFHTCQWEIKCWFSSGDVGLQLSESSQSFEPFIFILWVSPVYSTAIIVSQFFCLPWLFRLTVSLGRDCLLLQGPTQTTQSKNKLRTQQYFVRHPHICKTLSLTRQGKKIIRIQSGTNSSWLSFRPPTHWEEKETVLNGFPKNSHKKPINRSS